MQGSDSAGSQSHVLLPTRPSNRSRFCGQGHAKSRSQLCPTPNLHCHHATILTLAVAPRCCAQGWDFGVVTAWGQGKVESGKGGGGERSGKGGLQAPWGRLGRPRRGGRGTAKPAEWGEFSFPPSSPHPFWGAQPTGGGREGGPVGNSMPCPATYLKQLGLVWGQGRWAVLGHPSHASP